jgi:hypothetical protein
VPELVLRTCRCAKKDCLTQFRDQTHKLNHFRERFKTLEAHEKETYVANSLNCGAHFKFDGLDSAAECELEAGCFSESDLENDVYEESDEVFDESDAGSLPELYSESDSNVFPETDQEDQPSSSKRTYARRRAGPLEFFGKTVCVFAFQALMGVGTSTVQRLRRGKRAFTNNRRQKEPKHPMFGFSLDRGRKWVGIISFLWLVYHSVGEVLPTTVSMPNTMIETPFPKKVDTDFHERSVNAFMTSLDKYGHDIDVMNIGPGTFAGPKRHIQHTTRTES